jgi:TetR/AcrR family transcriptional repressor of uid operon
MTMPTNRVDRDKGQARRQQILEAAEACFRRRGFQGASVAEICKGAGVSAGHLYHFYDSKEAIIAAIVQRDLEEKLEMLEQLSQRADITTAMLDEIDEGVSEQLDNPGTDLMLEVMAEASRNPKVAEMVHRSDATARAKLAETVAKAKNCDPASPQLAAEVEVMIALFEGLSTRAICNPDLDRDAVAGVMRRMIRHILET